MDHQAEQRRARDCWICWRRRSRRPTARRDATRRDATRSRNSRIIFSLFGVRSAFVAPVEWTDTRRRNDGVVSGAVGASINPWGSEYDPRCNRSADALETRLTRHEFSEFSELAAERIATLTSTGCRRVLESPFQFPRRIIDNGYTDITIEGKRGSMDIRRRSRLREMADAVADRPRRASRLK